MGFEGRAGTAKPTEQKEDPRVDDAACPRHQPAPTGLVVMNGLGKGAGSDFKLEITC